jgi:hypothetical protein
VQKEANQQQVKPSHNTSYTISEEKTSRKAQLGEKKRWEMNRQNTAGQSIEEISDEKAAPRTLTALKVTVRARGSATQHPATAIATAAGGTQLVLQGASSRPLTTSSSTLTDNSSTMPMYHTEPALGDSISDNNWRECMLVHMCTFIHNRVKQACPDKCKPSRNEHLH